MRWERILLILSLISLYIHMSRKAIISFGGPDVTFVFEPIGIILLTMAVLKYRKNYEVPPLSAAYSITIFLYLFTTVVLSVVGYLKGHLFTYVAADALIFYVVPLCIIGGRYEQFWRDLQGPALAAFWIGLIIVAATLKKSTVEIGNEGVVTQGIEIGENFRAEVQSLGYDLQPYLTLWPLLFAIAYQSRVMNWRKVAGMLTIVGYLAISIIFLKRAPVARTLMYAVVIVLGSGVLQGRLRMRTAFLTIGGMVLGCLIVGGVYINNLKQRFETGENESRFAEAGALIDDMHGLDWVYGKAMGGYFHPPEGWKAGLVFVNYNLEMGRTNLHCGIFLPLLKGGIIYMALYYVFFLRLFWFKPRAWNLFDLNFAARTVLPVYTLFLLIEGPPTQTDPLAAVLIGLCCARASVPAEETESLPLAEYYDGTAFETGYPDAALSDARYHHSW